MERLKLWEKLILPDYRNLKHIRWGKVRIDSEICNGCGRCVRICPSKSLTLINKKACIKPCKGFVAVKPGINQCMSCCDCIAMCPENAITMESSCEWSRYFRKINLGPLNGPRLFSE